MLQTVGQLAIPDFSMFEFSIGCEVFGIDRSDTGGPSFDFTVATAEPGPVRTRHGMSMSVTDSLDAIHDVDLLIVPAVAIDRGASEPYLEAIRAAHARGARLLSFCSGAFILAQAGVLEGRRATTHWMYADRLARDYPGVEVDAGVLYVEDGGIVTSAGTSAGIDAALHIVPQERGAADAVMIARRMVVPPQRDGGQAQYIEAPVAACHDDSLAGLIDWMLEHLDEDLTVDALARRSFMSERTFARRFRDATGTSPGAWLSRQRVLRAQHWLEESDAELEDIARRCGFGTAAVMRHHFVRAVGVAPGRYRQSFGPRAAGQPVSARRP